MIKKKSCKDNVNKKRKVELKYNIRMGGIEQHLTNYSATKKR